jgi:hypothetical protein
MQDFVSARYFKMASRAGCDITFAKLANSCSSLSNTSGFVIIIMFYVANIRHSFELRKFLILQLHEDFIFLMCSESPSFIINAKNTKVLSRKDLIVRYKTLSVLATLQLCVQKIYFGLVHSLDYLESIP